jgi:hypothetical protein
MLTSQVPSTPLRLQASIPSCSHVSNTSTCLHNLHTSILHTTTRLLAHAFRLRRVQTPSITSIPSRASIPSYLHASIPISGHTRLHICIPTRLHTSNVFMPTRGRTLTSFRTSAFVLTCQRLSIQASMSSSLHTHTWAYALTRSHSHTLPYLHVSMPTREHTPTSFYISTLSYTHIQAWVHTPTPLHVSMTLCSHLGNTRT